MAGLYNKSKKQLIEEIERLRKELEEVRSSKQKPTKDSLTKNESQFRLFYENSPVPYHSLDINGNLLAVNQAWLDMLGYKENEVKGHPITEFLTPASNELLKERFPDFIKNGVVRNAEFELITKHGNIIDISLDGRIGADINGNFKQTHCVLHNITNRKKRENAIRMSETKFRTLFEKAVDYIIIFKLEDNNIKVIDANDSALKAHGYNRDEFIGMSIDKIIDETNLAKTPGRTKEILSDKILRFESVHIRKDQSRFPVEVTASRIDFNEEPFIITFERDMTGIKKAEQELSMLAHALKSINECVSITDLNDRILFVNQSFIDTYGYSEEELIGKHISFLRPPDDNHTGWQDILNLTMAGGWSGEIINQRKDGSIFPVHLSTSSIKDEKGNIISLIGVANDITEKKKAEQALLESEKNFRLLFENSPIGTYIASPDGTILDGNQAMLDILDSPSLEASKKVNVLTFPPLVKNGYAEVFKQCIESAEIQYLELPYTSKWGKTMHLSSYLVPMLNSRGKVDTIYTLMQDVSAQKSAEKELTEERKRLKDILEGTNAGTWDWNIQTGELILNERWAEITGYTLKELMPVNIQTWIDSVYPPDLPNAQEQLDLHFNKKINYYDVVFRQHHKNGGLVWVNARGKIVQWTQDGKPLKMSGIHLDITQRREAEEKLKKVNIRLASNNKKLEQLNTKLTVSMEEIRIINAKLEKAKEKAEESDRLKSAFLANMSHEIRTPMNGIMGFTELLKDPEHSEEEKMEFIRVIRQSGERMLSTVNDLIDISKIESGQIEVYPSEVDINAEMDYLYGFFKPEVEMKGIKFFVANSLSGKKAIVYTDKEKFLAIMTNLIKNAVKFTDKGSIGFGCSRRDSMLEFFVRDSGIGIPPDKQAIIFNRFAQADYSYSRNFEGAGLGLSISKAYVELLGGTIRVESEPGKGTKFYFTLPCKLKSFDKTDNIQPRQEKIRTIAEKKYKILIVEDEDTANVFLNLVLKKLSREILFAKTGYEAIEICKNNPDLDIILMDIKMPGLDGYETTRQIRKFNKEIIIIAQTAYAFQGDREKVIETGCNDYIAKPINRDALLKIIRKQLM